MIQHKQDLGEGNTPITVLQGVSQYVGEWEVLCVRQEQIPMPCFLCEKPLTEIAQIGAWKLHTASPICTECVEKHEVAVDIPIDEIEERRINP